MRELILFVVFWSLAARAQKASHDLTEVTIEDLMQIEVTSVSKKEQKLVAAPAAIFVITQEDIRRSGLTSIPEILRMAPGLEVARVDGNKWAISSRGFNAQFSHMMLVLMDGRSVYLPSSSGVYWDEQETIIEDIDRIEVIRGPGATLWGANAVNGVVNIITKSAADTQGGLVTVSEGNEDHTVDGARYGGRIGGRGSYRVYSKYFRRANLAGVGDRREPDGTMILSGFRSDWNLSDRDFLMVQGGVFRESANVRDVIPILTAPFEQDFADAEKSTGGNLVANWRHRSSDHSLFTVLGYFDNARVDTKILSENSSSFNLDFQHSWTPMPRHDIVWGLGFRDNASTFRNSQAVAFLPTRRREQLYSGFVQDEIHLATDKLSLIVGSKFEHNDFTGMEVQPNVRLLWTPNVSTTIWAAVSRAVSTPSYFDEGGQISSRAFPTDTGLPIEVRIFGSQKGVSELLRAHEIGYRSQLNKRFSVDWTGFYNVYHHLRTYDPAPSFVTGDPQPLHIVAPLILKNSMHGESEGIEIAGTWNAAKRWRISSSYSWLSLQLHADASSEPSNEAEERQSPQHQGQVRSEFDLSRKAQFDTSVYYVGALPALSVRAYTRVDARFGWRLSPAFELSIGGQNLQGGRHFEYVSEGPFAPSRVGRTLYARITWRSE